MDCGVYWQARYTPAYWFMFVYNANADWASYSHKSNCPPFFRGKHLFKNIKINTPHTMCSLSIVAIYPYLTTVWSQRCSLKEFASQVAARQSIGFLKAPWPQSPSVSSRRSTRFRLPPAVLIRTASLESFWDAGWESFSRVRSSGNMAPS